VGKLSKGVPKNTDFDVDFKSVKKVSKKFIQNYQQKTLRDDKKVKKLHYHFFGDLFLVKFLQLFN
jgi:6-pyruvoyl-tetrahydropterin synthase